MRKILIFLLILLMATLVQADQTCFVGEVCEFTTIGFNTTSEYFTGEVNNSLRYNNGTYIYENQSMTNLGDGNYIYNYTFNNSGEYIRKSFADDKKEDEVITVLDLSNDSLAGLIITNWFWIVVLVFALMFLVLMFLIKRKDG